MSAFAILWRPFLPIPPLPEAFATRMPDPHRPIQEIRDAVHGFVKLSAAEVEIVNTPAFQRLRDVRQLAVAHMVYPGAMHTRFEHSIGCVHLSDLVLSILEEGKPGRPAIRDALAIGEGGLPRARLILRLASLLHDLGHPPFSHSGEYLLPEWSAAEATLGPKPKSEKKSRVSHEAMTAHLIRNTEIAELIERYFQNLDIGVEEVIAVAVSPGASRLKQPAPILNLLHQLLTWDYGTDRMDYLLRDAHHSGQPTGAFDHKKLLSSIALIDRDTKGNERDPTIGIDESGWLIAEQMVVSRYLMYISLYFHKTKRIYEKHVERYMPQWCRERFKSPTLPIDHSTYSTISESMVMTDVFLTGRDAAKPGHRDCRPFIDRSHFRVAKELVLSDNAAEEVVRYTVNENGKEEERECVINRHPDKKRLDAYCAAVEAEFGEDVIIDTADHSATKLFSKGGDVLVAIDGKTRYLQDLSEIVRGMPAKVWRCRVYAPKDKREVVKQFCNKWLDANKPGRSLINDKHE